MSEITNKTMVLVTRLGDFWVTPDQGKSILDYKRDDPNGNIEIEDNNISFSSIDGLLKADDYDKLQKKRRGAWQCKYHYWHERHEQCAHAQFGRYAS